MNFKCSYCAHVNEVNTNETRDLKRQEQDFWMAQYGRLFVTLGAIFTIGMVTILVYKGLGYWVK